MTSRLVSGFNHVAVLTVDLDRAIRFYCDMFGLEVFIELHDERRHVTLEVARHSHLHLFEAPDSPYATASGEMLGRGHLDHVALTAPDLDTFMAIRDRLVERGASDGTVTDFGIGRSIQFRDPDQMVGEVIVMLDDDLANLVPEGRAVVDD